MAKGRALKVYRTPTGFHDAYVAAASQKAALAAWGSAHDLFARGVAEVVTDAALTKEPLARPGEVIKRLRGTAAEQLAALSASPKTAKAGGKPAKAKPPSRTALTKVEQALADAEARHGGERKELDAREAALKRERQQAEKAQAEEAARLQRAVEKAKSAYDAAVGKWAG